MKTIAAVRRELLGMLAQNLNPAGLTPHKDEDDIGEVCIANISPRERLKRLIGGLVPFGLALGILAWQIAAHADRLWRLPLFILFVAATSGFFQWRDKT